MNLLHNSSAIAYFNWFVSHFRAGIIIVIILLILWIAIDTAKDVKRLVSFAGLAIYILIGYIFSKHRSRVSILLPFCIPMNDPLSTVILCAWSRVLFVVRTCHFGGTLFKPLRNDGYQCHNFETFHGIVRNLCRDSAK